MHSFDIAYCRVGCLPDCAGFALTAPHPRAQGKLDEAEELYQKSLTINLQKLGSNHIKVEKTYVSIARAKIGQVSAHLRVVEVCVGAQFHHTTSYRMPLIASLHAYPMVPAIIRGMP